MAGVITCVVRRRWRWYQLIAIFGSAAAGAALLVVGLLGGDVALWIVGGVWLVLALLGARNMSRWAWSITVEGTAVALRGHRLNVVIPASEIRAVRVSDYAFGSRRLLSLDTERLGRVRFGPTPPNTASLITALGKTVPELRF